MLMPTRAERPAGALAEKGVHPGGISVPAATGEVAGIGSRNRVAGVRSNRQRQVAQIEELGIVFNRHIGIDLLVGAHVDHAVGAHLGLNPQKIPEP